MSRGSIFQRNNGWGFSLRYTDGNESKQVKRQGYGTKAMAEKALREALTTLDSGRAVSSARLTLENYLLGFDGVGGWLEKYERRQKVKATTLSAVTNHVNAYIVPRLGKVSLGALDTDTLESFYLDLLEGGKKNGEPLNPKTVRNIAGTLHKALEDAVRSRKIPNNPSSHAELPRWEKPDLVIWEESNLIAFLEYAEESDDPMFPLWLLALSTGLRRGEILGLRWADIDLDNGHLVISRTRLPLGGGVIDSTPKSKTANRRISLDPDLVATLRAFSLEQRKSRLELGGTWQAGDLVATDLDGSPCHPLTFSRRWGRACEAAGVPVIRLHDSRHTAAVTMIRHGVPIAIVSGRLGHANVSTTMNNYWHFTESADREASAVMGAVLSSRKKVTKAVAKR
jgi:integrase